MKRYVSILLGALAMLAVAVFSAFLSLRLAIHGREVVVPNLSGRSDADAAEVAKSLGLNLSVENRFYSSAMGPNHVLSQSPAAGSRVRRGWQVRVSESLGTQKVEVPDLSGQNERPASLVLRRLQLDTGTIARLPAPAPAGVVLAQSPPANSAGLNGPKVALLVSDDETSADAAAYMMPSLIGQTLAAAAVRLSSAGLHIGSVQEPQPTPAADPSADPGTAGAATTEVPAMSAYIPPEAFTVDATITSQSPGPGRRVTRADTIRVMMSH